MQNKNMRSAIIASVVMICGHFMLIPFISPYFIRNCGLSQSDITGIYLYGGIATVFSAPLIGKLTDLYGAKPMFRILVYCTIPISLLMSFFPKIDLL